MSLILADIDSSFATRERAREIAASYSDGDLVIELDSVFVSPSFLAELITLIETRGPVTVRAEAASFNLQLARKLVSQLQLANSVNVEADGPTVWRRAAAG